MSVVMCVSVCVVLCEFVVWCGVVWCGVVWCGVVCVCVNSLLLLEAGDERVWDFILLHVTQHFSCNKPDTWQ